MIVIGDTSSWGATTVFHSAGVGQGVVTALGVEAVSERDSRCSVDHGMGWTWPGRIVMADA